VKNKSFLGKISVQAFTGKFISTQIIYAQKKKDQAFFMSDSRMVVKIKRINDRFAFSCNRAQV